MPNNSNEDIVWHLLWDTHLQDYEGKLKQVNTLVDSHTQLVGLLVPQTRW
jgi:hypothetical protein